jgi:hypothetical protein
MIRRLAPGCLLGCWVLTLSASAQEGVRPPEPIPPPTVKEGPPPPPPDLLPPPCGPTVDKCLKVPQALIVEDQNAVAIPKLQLRDVELGRGRYCVELDFRQEKQTITVMELKPRIEKQSVCVTKLVPQTVLDECGKPCTKMCEIPDVQVVDVTKYDVVPVQREVVVTVPVLKPGREFQVIGLALDHYTAAGIETRLHLEEHSNEVHVAVPACPVPDCPTPCFRAPVCTSK